jgi:hypothetical protein
MRYFKANSNRKGFSGKNWPGVGEVSFMPNKVFNFSAYPTILIYYKTGKLVFSRSGFTNKWEAQEMRDFQNFFPVLLVRKKS